MSLLLHLNSEKNGFKIFGEIVFDEKIMVKAAPRPRPRVFNRGRSVFTVENPIYKEMVNSIKISMANQACMADGYKYLIVITSKNPYRNADTDNIAKGIMDTITQLQKFWLDDRNVDVLSRKITEKIKGKATQSWIALTIIKIKNED